jgi:hypothetical protein
MGGTLRTVLTLNSDRSVRSGSTADLVDAIRRGADLRIGTAFRHNEHIDTRSSSNELIEEVAEFRQTWLLDDRWAAGIMTLRMPVELPEGFGPRPSMSFFLYNQDGTQAIARPYLDGQPPTGTRGPSPLDDMSDMPRYHQFDSFDAGTNAPSSNFVYDFDSYRFMVNDRWREVLAHDHTGRPTFGSVEALNEAFLRGAPVKVAISKFGVGLVPPGETAPEHEAFIHCGSCYYYTDRKLFITGTHPAVRIKPAIPLRYESGGWDFCWLVARTDGQVERWRCDPHTLAFDRSTHRYDMRWFVSGD